MAANQNMDDPVQSLSPQTRPIRGTEQSWVRAVRGGTGITVCVLLLSKPPDPSFLQNALRNIQNSHPILRSKLHSTTASFTIPPSPHLNLQSIDLSSTSLLLSKYSSVPDPFHRVLEHELNQNQLWAGPDDDDCIDTFFSTLYALPEQKCAVALRLHTAVCDRTAAVSLLRELCRLVQLGEAKRGFVGSEKDDGVNLGIEDLVPSGKANKALWARGVDLIGYSLNSFRFCNLEFKDALSAQSSGSVRLQMNPDDTLRLLSGCKERGIKLCGAIEAAGMMAAYSSKQQLPNHRGQLEKYAVVTLIDCRTILDPPLHHNNFGFYHSAILNTHDICGGSTEFWELANRCYSSFKSAVDSNKHFSDMNDMNFLMCKAIDNPNLTPSSSLRTSLMAVFEDTVIDNSIESASQEIGLLDYIGCSSVHGVGPSIAVFDTIRDGALDCACVYPTPLHSREQMQELIEHMKRILIEGSTGSAALTV